MRWPPTALGGQAPCQPPPPPAGCGGPGQTGSAGWWRRLPAGGRAWAAGCARERSACPDQTGVGVEVGIVAGGTYGARGMGPAGGSGAGRDTLPCRSRAAVVAYEMPVGCCSLNSLPCPASRGSTESNKIGNMMQRNLKHWNVNWRVACSTDGA